MSGRTTLPDFARPPLVEVALSVQFNTLEGLRTPHLGLLWTDFRDRFPKFEEHPPIPPMTEKFGLRPAPAPSFSVDLMNVPPLPRCWFLNEAGTELIQVQQDRFIRNWRKVGTGDEYPRYERIRKSFEEDFSRFVAFVRREKLGEMKPNQCEVTYVDHVIGGEGWARHGQIDEVVTLWAKRKADAFPPEPEDVRFAVRYLIPSSEGEPLGRLHFELQPGILKAENRPIFVLNFTARGRPETEDIDGVLKFFDLGRDWAGRAFVAVTSERMHEAWGRRDG
jgi:uncharacterized protein (TIGR04255 family)